MKIVKVLAPALVVLIPLQMKAQSSSATDMDELKAQLKAQQKLLEKQQAQIQSLETTLAKQQEILMQVTRSGTNAPAPVVAVERTSGVETRPDGVRVSQDQGPASAQVSPSPEAEKVAAQDQPQQAAPTTQSAATVLTCSSNPGERQVCKADTAAGVALLHSTGNSGCLLGKTWGYESAGLWVSDGCAGEFAIGGTREESGLNKFVGMFEPYGQLRTLFADYQDTQQVQDNASRIGMNFTTRGKIKVFATTEWGVNLVQSSTQFNLSGAGSGDIGSLQTLTTPVFTARLGFIGTDFGPFGRVSVGKEYAPHYDIASYTTDRFNVFGGQGTFAYVAGTDGGPTGTGRADRVVQYRNTFLKIVDVAVQGQFRGGDTGTSTEGIGGSVQIHILPGLRVGGGYTRTDWPLAKQQEIQGLGGASEYVAAGTRLDWRILQLGFVYAQQHHGDLVFVPATGEPGLVTPVAFSARGVEVYSRAGSKRFGLIGGFTYEDPTRLNPLLNPDFKTRYFILGAEYFFAPNGKVYTESKLDDNSITQTGAKGYSVFTVGFRYDFSLHLSHEE